VTSCNSEDRGQNRDESTPDQRSNARVNDRQDNIRIPETRGVLRSACARRMAPRSVIPLSDTSMTDSPIGGVSEKAGRPWCCKVQAI